jgi:excisionase family DNA binding protein
MAAAHVEPLAYGPPDAAKVLGISRARVYELIADGTLTSFKLGQRRLIRRETIERFLAGLEAGKIDVPANGAK